MAEKLIQYWAWIALVYAAFGVAFWVGLLQDRYETSKSFRGLYGSGSKFEFGISDLFSLVLLIIGGPFPWIFSLGLATLAWFEDHDLILIRLSPTRNLNTKLIATGFIQVFFVAMNSYFISKQMYVFVGFVGFIISYIWTLNVKSISIGSGVDRLCYAFGAGTGAVSGLGLSSFIVNLV